METKIGVAPLQSQPPKKGTRATFITLASVIVLSAISYVGFKETPNNSGFQVASFEKSMREVGWHKYDSWCVYFCKLCWYQSIKNDTVRNLAMKLITGNSQNTLANFQKDISGYFIVSDTAIVGSIVIWQHYNNGKPEWSGHAGLVDSAFKNRRYNFHDIEGNTNNNGSSNGNIVLPKYHVYNRTAVYE